MRPPYLAAAALCAALTFTIISTTHAEAHDRDGRRDVTARGILSPACYRGRHCRYYYGAYPYYRDGHFHYRPRWCHRYYGRYRNSGYRRYFGDYNRY